MLERLRQKMRDEGIETVCINSSYDFLYFFGLEMAGYCFITQEDVEMVLPRFYMYEDVDARYAFSLQDYLDHFENLDYDKVYIAGKEGLLPEKFEVEQTDIVNELRKIKTMEEVEKIREACQITDRAFEELKPNLVGLTEFEAVGELKKFYIEEKVPESFITNKGESLVQRNVLRPHRPPSHKKILSEDLVIVDTGCRVDHYCSDVTRTFCENPNERQIELFNAVRDIQKELIEMIEPGLSVAEWKEHEYRLVEEKGFNPDKNVLYFSHGIGLETHEPPTLSHSCDEKFKEGMVVTVEPGLHLKELGGVRIEDTVHVTSNGSDQLSQTPKEL